MKYISPRKPTLYFIGVSTAYSSIMNIFPQWARHLKLGDAQIVGMDFPLKARAEDYRAAVAFIKDEPNAYGALITSHKINLLRASHDLFDSLDPYAQLLGEISCIAKSGGKLMGHAKDAYTSALSLQAMITDDYWTKYPTDMLCMGAGGANLALTSYLLQQARGSQPQRLIITDIRKKSLKEMATIHRQIAPNRPVEYRLCESPAAHDAILGSLLPHAIVINGTGLGKDLAGSPLTDDALFPAQAIVWEYNYRGERLFLQQAKAQQAQQQLQIHDGWTYFIYGWTQIMAEVFHIHIPTKGKLLDKLSDIATLFR